MRFSVLPVSPRFRAEHQRGLAAMRAAELSRRERQARKRRAQPESPKAHTKGTK